ncbi:60S ribosome biogenesis protein Sqt1 [Metarhizium album ARSEF 1941]|uniref:60S ribosome biogenesis protein Sqt1 n=1 Tax=Metarhizium album (strain ARSEF 1941) TaxID=1081103 RepID=A0A0B2X6L1_METAS|nr:60S ribosome biogenesis protein Sqt1 [Metarhizium album ARSEF 1941]KHO01388.1 60S ribosome biogenesis protein Sqt1 [Metarhizium album ARSEF 1941]
MSHPEEVDDDLLDLEDAAEEIENSADDIAMDSDAEDEGGEEDEDEEVLLQNDSIAYFDLPPDSLFTIAQHPVHPSLVAVGGSAGPQEDAPGAGWLLDTSAAASRPVLPASYASNPAETPKSTQLDSLFALEGHTDSINTLAWTLPRGEFLVSGGLDGRVKVWKADTRPGAVEMTPVGDAQEVEEVNWISPCPSPNHQNTVALGASDGSVWVYTIDASDASNPLQIVQSYFLHTAPCTAGAWTPDGHLLATVSEDSSLYVWDVWGDAAARNVTGENGMTVVSLTGEDQRFEVDGGLYSIVIDPKGSFVATGGAGGAVKVVSLPRLSAADATAGGQILASLHTQGDSVESLAVSLTATTPPTTLLAAGSVDGSICVYDAARRFAVRRHIAAAHEDHSVVRLEFVKNTWLLTSCGMDGVVRRWDLRSGGATDRGLVNEWKGHRGGGEGGGVMGFVQGETGERVVTAGDDGVVLVFEA